MGERIRYTMTDGTIIFQFNNVYRKDPDTQEVLTYVVMNYENGWFDVTTDGSNGRGQFHEDEVKTRKPN